MAVPLVVPLAQHRHQHREALQQQLAPSYSERAAEEHLVSTLVLLVLQALLGQQLHQEALAAVTQHRRSARAAAASLQRLAPSSLLLLRDSERPVVMRLDLVLLVLLVLVLHQAQAAAAQHHRLVRAVAELQRLLLPAAAALQVLFPSFQRDSSRAEAARQLHFEALTAAPKTRQVQGAAAAPQHPRSTRAAAASLQRLAPSSLQLRRDSERQVGLALTLVLLEQPVLAVRQPHLEALAVAAAQHPRLVPALEEQQHYLEALAAAALQVVLRPSFQRDSVREVAARQLEALAAAAELLR